MNNYTNSKIIIIIPLSIAFRQYAIHKICYIMCQYVYRGRGIDSYVYTWVQQARFLLFNFKPLYWLASSITLGNHMLKSVLHSLWKMFKNFFCIYFYDLHYSCIYSLLMRGNYLEKVHGRGQQPVWFGLFLHMLSHELSCLSHSL